MPDLLKPTEVAEMLGVSTETLRTWRKEKHGPRPTYLSARTIRYRADEVDEWLAEQEREER